MDTINIVQFIIERCVSENRSAFIWRGESISYSQLFDLAAKIAATMQAWDVQHGARVLLPMNDTPAMVASFLGALWIGAIPVPLNPRLGRKSFQYILTDSEAVAVICEPGAAHEIRLAAHETMMTPRIVVQDLYPRQNAGEISKLSDMFSAQEHPPFVPLADDASAYWQYTSGTTGKPKAVMHHGRGMIYNSRLFAADVLGINSDDRIYSTAKLFFGYGLGNSLFFNLLAGATALLDDRWPTPEFVLENAQSFTPTVFFSTPTLYNALFTQGAQFKTYMADKTRYCSAGGHLPGPLFDKWSKTFDIEILDGFGTTEVGHIFLCNRPGSARAGVTGKIVQGYDVKLLDKNGATVPAGVNGVLWARGPSVGLGYHNRPSESHDRFRDRWYRTGDVFLQDLDGNYTFVGREDDLFKSKGRWVAPAEIEAYILENFADVSEVAVVPAEDADGLTAPAICLVVRTTILGEMRIENIENRIREAMAGRFDSFMQPKHYYFMPILPKNDNGKLIRHELVASLSRKADIGIVG